MYVQTFLLWRLVRDDGVYFLTTHGWVVAALPHRGTAGQTWQAAGLANLALVLAFRTWKAGLTLTCWQIMSSITGHYKKCLYKIKVSSVLGQAGTLASAVNRRGYWPWFFHGKSLASCVSGSTSGIKI